MFGPWYGSRRMRRVLIGLAAVVFVVTALNAQTKTSKTVRRAQPPPPAKLRSDLFYADAFKEGLVGQRPADLGKAAATASAPASSAPAAGSALSPAAAAPGGWSGLISAAT